MKLPVYELKINESLADDSEVSYVALVDEPAIQKDFLAFKNEFVEPAKGESEEEYIGRCVKVLIDEGTDHEQAMAICYSKWEAKFAEGSYTDYPEAAVENAKTALRYAEENGWGDCGESTGKLRANQLANKEPISRDTIARMAAFERHRQNSDRPLGEGCGRLMWLAWGGDEGIAWAQRKLKQIDSNFGGPGSGRRPEGGDDSNNTNIDVKIESTGDGEFKYYVTDKDGNEIGKLEVSQVNDKIIIDNIFVDENSQKQGIASKMVDDVINNYKGEYYTYYDSNDNAIDKPYLIETGMTVSDAGQRLYNKIKPKIDDFNNSQMKLKLSKHRFKIINEEKRIISGPLMLADELIYRNNEKFGEHYVKFTGETIKAIAIKFAKRKYQANVNLMHDPEQKVEGVTMFESWIVDKERGIKPMQGFEDVADGSWFGSFYVENEEVWGRVKQGEFRGFSVEGLFDYEAPKSYEEQMLEKIKNLLYS